MDKLNIKQISRRLERLRPLLNESKIRTGWVRYLRRGLGMKSAQLASRLGISQGALSELEKREEKGALTLKKLSEAAEALNCELVYFLLPKEPIEKTIERQVTKKAKNILKKVSTHMELEDQKVSISTEEKLERIRDQLISKGDIW